MGFFDGGKRAAAEARQNALIQEMQGELDAIDKSMATIEFALDGTILDANENFLKLMGYTLDEVKGEHHCMFVDPDCRQSEEYRRFWERLARGECDAGQYRRIGIVGKEVWIQASYNPILDADGKPYKVMKFATDVSEQKRQAANFEGQLAAINKSMAVIEFSLDGIIISANDNFLNILGYTQDEIRGKHHRIFVDPVYSASVEYRQFWEKLGRGEYDTAQYIRIGKGGQEVCIQATYNPILDANGRPFKVVKFATDITGKVKSTRALHGVVAQVQSVVGAARDGDLTRRIPIDSSTGELGALCAEINALVQSMADALLTIKEGSDAISNTSKAMAASVAKAGSEVAQITQADNSKLPAPAKVAATARRYPPSKKPATELGSKTKPSAFLKSVEKEAAEWDGF